MNMKMSYSALLVLFLSLTFFTPSTLAGLWFSPLRPPSCPDGSCGIPRQLPLYKPPPLYRSTSKGKP
ncbi:hypothetical protein AAZX31_10G122800 [Glycine max]|uniref:Uncharacterized protein n=1 Tax=Glycine max TaxID=3847 RepID=K7LJ36_SOYBN|nr:hypothetical protein JHK85_028654 [Glycine max]KAG5003977.1 hypothetical protein JHK86_028116 [Glycine max]KAG5151773.1 hypothetical protein JHK84_028245 [Glycine max]KAH1137997.1 hypothetical protein GYH30_027838 [Glycine max]KRH33528.1 hypothetical protein GLYMA_10G129100v4 [Glycine max]